VRRVIVEEMPLTVQLFQQAPETVRIRISVDIDEITKRLGPRALYSSTKKASALFGAVKVVLVREPKRGAS
jgi:hypothetical protein